MAHKFPTESLFDAAKHLVEDSPTERDDIYFRSLREAVERAEKVALEKRAYRPTLIGRLAVIGRAIRAAARVMGPQSYRDVRPPQVPELVPNWFVQIQQIHPDGIVVTYPAPYDAELKGLGYAVVSVGSRKDSVCEQHSAPTDGSLEISREAITCPQ